jgi:hypothetical protein
MLDLEKLCTKKGIKITCEYGGASYNENFPNAHPYKRTLRKGDKQLTVPFYMGPAHSEEPTAADVLNCLISDTFAAENHNDWVSFAEEFGYLEKPSSYDYKPQKFTDQVRRAQKIYEQCVKMAPKVRHFLGNDFDALAGAEH